MKILLACAYGMSTNMLVQKMKAAVKAQGREDTIRAVSQEQIKVELGNFDVLLLGPQISYALEDICQVVDGRAPVAVINAMDYGRLNGEAVLALADRLTENSKS